MDDYLKSTIQEYFAGCCAVNEVARLYADLKIEVENQMEYMMEQLTEEK